VQPPPAACACAGLPPGGGHPAAPPPAAAACRAPAGGGGGGGGGGHVQQQRLPQLLPAGRLWANGVGGANTHFQGSLGLWAVHPRPSPLDCTSRGAQAKQPLAQQLQARPLPPAPRGACLLSGCDPSAQLGQGSQQPLWRLSQLRPSSLLEVLGQLKGSCARGVGHAWQRGCLRAMHSTRRADRHGRRMRRSSAPAWRRQPGAPARHPGSKPCTC